MTNTTAAQGAPTLMFPHPAEILRAMTEQGKARTSAENIADVLCALAKAGMSSNAAQGEPTLTDDQILDLARQHLTREQFSSLIFHRWKDGIDIDYPTVELLNFARAAAPNTAQPAPPMYLADGVTSNPEWLAYKHTVLNPAAAAEQPVAVEGAVKCVIYLDEDPIDVAQFYRAKGFEKLPPNPTMRGAEIRACGWKKNDYPMYLMCPEGRPATLVGDTQSIPLTNGMRFWCIPTATTRMS